MTSIISPITPGRLIMSFPPLFAAFGAFYFDWSETHVKNPKWPPHARFHNGQTMSMSIALLASSFYYIWRPVKSMDLARDSIKTATFLGTVYFVTGLSGILYPGADWTDPEFEYTNFQLYLFSACIGISATGSFLELQRLGGSILG